MATLSAVTMGVLAGTPETPGADLLAASSTSGARSEATTDAATSDAATSEPTTDPASGSTALARRGDVVSRSQVRTAAKAESAARLDMEVDQQARRLARKLDRTMWTTADLNLWEGPGEKTDKLGLLPAIRQVAVTGREQGGRTQVLVDGESRWVTADYLSASKPKPEPEGPSLGGACTNGTTASGGDANVQKVHEAVCANWPSVSTYGTLRGGGGDHPLGRAVDIMVSGDTGWDIAEFVRANASVLGVTYVIYAQHIWSVERSGEGWRAMENRGSVTANHFDHVHVSVY